MLISTPPLLNQYVAILRTYFVLHDSYNYDCHDDEYYVYDNAYDYSHDDGGYGYGNEYYKEE